MFAEPVPHPKLLGQLSKSDNSYILIDDDDDGVCFVLDQHAELDFYNATALKQQSMCRHIVPLGHIFPIPSQPVFVLTPLCRVLNVKATDIALTRPGFAPTICT